MASKLSYGQEASRSKTRVMVVDDSPGVLDSLVLLLIHFGFDTAGFLDASDAFAVLNEYKPDVAICDAHMEEVEDGDEPVPQRIKGIETASKIKRARPGCKVIVLSGNLKPKTVIDRAERLGAKVLMMPKPGNPRELISKVRAG